MKSHLRSKLLLGVAAIPWAAYWPVYQEDPVLPALQDRQKVRVKFSHDCSASDPKAEIYDLEVVRSEDATRQGLSGRKKPLGKNEGMLFVFERPEAMGFWMKETYIPLQLVWISPYGSLLGVHEMQVEKDPKKPTKTYAAPGLLSAAIEFAPGTITPPAPSKGSTPSLKFCIIP
jgi:uncharacterized membrane protein (UPF0127 family)